MIQVGFPKSTEKKNDKETSRARQYLTVCDDFEDEVGNNGSGGGVEIK